MYKLYKTSSKKKLQTRLLLTLAGVLVLIIILQEIANAATTPPLGTTLNFVVLAGSAITNTGPTTISGGDVGISPGTAATGFASVTITPPGVLQAGNAVALQAQNDVTTAYNNLAGQTCNTPLTGQDLGGMTLQPGVYCFPNTSAQLTGSLILDGAGNPNAVFIIQIGSTLTTASDSVVQVTGNLNPCNVFWQIGSSATLGTRTNFAGNILALTDITLVTNASISGRALARNGAVTMDTNNISLAACAIAAPTPTATAIPTATPVPTATGVPAPTVTPMPTSTAIPAPTQSSVPSGTAVASISATSPVLTTPSVGAATVLPEETNSPPLTTELNGTVTIPSPTVITPRLPGLPNTGNADKSQPDSDNLFIGLVATMAIFVGSLSGIYLLNKRRRS